MCKNILIIHKIILVNEKEEELKSINKIIVIFESDLETYRNKIKQKFSLNNSVSIYFEFKTMETKNLTEKMSNLIKVIHSNNRMRILQILQSIQKPLSVNEIIDLVKLPQPTVSGELKILRSQKLVHQKRKGKQIFYSLNKPFFTFVMTKFAEITNQIDDQL